MDWATVAGNVSAVAESFAAQRSERQRRRHLDEADFARLVEAGFPLAAVPVADGGLWESVARSTRPVAELLRTLAGADSSVALVCAMHPSVLCFWLATPRVPAPDDGAWVAQRELVFRTVREGAWWGTITSEPGSGGDVGLTRAVAEPAGGGGETAYRLSGAKHFGSGSGIMSYVLTSARPADETAPDWFYLDVQGAPWDGSSGLRLLAEWDGHGMTATQSHAFAFKDVPATRFAWPGHMLDLQGAAGPAVGAFFTAVVVGIAETALATARESLARRRDTLRAYERVEWTRARTEGWLIRQAYEGMLRAVEASDVAADDARGGTADGAPGQGTQGQGARALAAVLMGKTAIAELAEAMLGRLCRVLGGGTYSRASPFGYWYEDVRALGFLRPPWGLVHDRLFDVSWASD